MIKNNIKRMVGNLVGVLYKLFSIIFISKKISEKKYNITICAIFKDESLYLKEWLEYNILIGVEHFYLYNNNSSDDYYTILEKYILNDMVTLIDWPYEQGQMSAYKDCIKRFRSESKWIGFIDLDEFIVPIDKNNIYDFLKPFEKKYGSVKIYWKMFGAGGLVKRDVSRLVIEDFTISWPGLFYEGKCFYNTAFNFDENYKRNTIFHHNLWTKFCFINLPPVNMNGKFFSTSSQNPIKKYNDVKIQINHYLLKSFDEYVYRISKGDAFFEDNPHRIELFFKHEMNNTTVDYSIFKYLILLKQRLNK